MRQASPRHQLGPSPGWTTSLIARRPKAGAWSRFHSHPTDYRRFSDADDRSDAPLFPGIHALVDRPVPHASVVMVADGSMFGRSVGPAGEFHSIASIMVAGDDIEIWHHAPPAPSAHVQRRTRTAAFGHRMTAELGRLTAVVMGCSGTGSIVIEQLARLGFGRLILVDPQVIERKNLNRILNATWRDAEGGRQ